MNIIKFHNLEFYHDDDAFLPSTISKLIVDVPNVKDAKVLDVGCGIGSLSIFFKKKGAAEVTALDVVDKHIELVKKNAKKHNVEIKALKSNLYENVKEKYDIIFCDVSGIPSTICDFTDWYPNNIPKADETGNNLVLKSIEGAKKYLKRGGKFYVLSSTLSDQNQVIKKFDKHFTEWSMFSKTKKWKVVFEKHLPFSKGLEECYKMKIINENNFSMRGTRKLWTFWIYEGTA